MHKCTFRLRNVKKFTKHTVAQSSISMSSLRVQFLTLYAPGPAFRNQFYISCTVCLEQGLKHQCQMFSWMLSLIVSESGSNSEPCVGWKTDQDSDKNPTCLEQINNALKCVRTCKSAIVNPIMDVMNECQFQLVNSVFPNIFYFLKLSLSQGIKCNYNILHRNVQCCSPHREKTVLQYLC